jgi:hypothetical protein
LGPPPGASYDFSMSTTAERRRRRSRDTIRALELQLDASRRAGALEAMVLSDGDGLLLASTGDREACQEVAARLPIIGRRVAQFEGTLLSAGKSLRVRMRRFVVGTCELYIAAVGGGGESGERAIGGSIGGATRILAI